LRNLQELYLTNNHLKNFPTKIGNLIKLEKLYLCGNQLQSLPTEILKFKDCLLVIDDTSYDIDNLNINNNEIIIFTYIYKKITNLPFNTTEIWLKSGIKNDLIKLPFGCIIKYY